jgi:hypothetical protein
LPHSPALSSRSSCVFSHLALHPTDISSCDRPSIRNTQQLESYLHAQVTMELKSLVLAVAGLLVLASAATPPISPHYAAAQDLVVPPRAAVAVTEDFAIDNTDLHSCRLNCAFPWKKCVTECGGGDSCEKRCSCKLFSHPKSLCRVRSEWSILASLFSSVLMRFDRVCAAANWVPGNQARCPSRASRQSVRRLQGCCRRLRPQMRRRRGV